MYCQIISDPCRKHALKRKWNVSNNIISGEVLCARETGAGGRWGQRRDRKTIPESLSAVICCSGETCLRVCAILDPQHPVPSFFPFHYQNKNKVIHESLISQSRRNTFCLFYSIFCLTNTFLCIFLIHNHYNRKSLSKKEKIVG